MFNDVITGDVEGSTAVRKAGKVDGGKRAKNRSSLGGSDCASLTCGRDVAIMIVNRQKEGFIHSNERDMARLKLYYTALTVHLGCRTESGQLLEFHYLQTFLVSVFKPLTSSVLYYRPMNGHTTNGTVVEALPPPPPDPFDKPPTPPPPPPESLVPPPPPDDLPPLPDDLPPLPANGKKVKKTTGSTSNSRQPLSVEELLRKKREANEAAAKVLFTSSISEKIYIIFTLLSV